MRKKRAPSKIVAEAEPHHSRWRWRREMAEPTTMDQPNRQPWPGGMNASRTKEQRAGSQSQATTTTSAIFRTWKVCNQNEFVASQGAHVAAWDRRRMWPPWAQSWSPLPQYYTFNNIFEWRKSSTNNKSNHPSHKNRMGIYISINQATKDSILEKVKGPLLVLLLELRSGMNTWQIVRKTAGADWLRKLWTLTTQA